MWLLVFSGAICAQDRAHENGLAGTWQGVLQLPGAELRIVFRISQNADGSWQALLDSPDQGAGDIPTSKVVAENERLLIEVQVVAGAFEGENQGRFQRNRRPVQGRPPHPPAVEKATRPGAETGPVRIGGSATESSSFTNSNQGCASVVVHADIAPAQRAFRAWAPPPVP